MRISRLLIANRGEIALRIIRACRELGVESVAVYSDADRGAPHTLAADHAVAIGPAPAAQSYLSIPRIVDAARTSGADAIHPGYGFLAENAMFAEQCIGAGIVFVGPPPSAIARMGSKIEARRVAAEARVPVTPGEMPADQTDAGVVRAVTRTGLPALIKASAGGGGKGMRRVEKGADENAIVAAIQAARREATSAFGDGTLYVERLIESAHHIEVQVFADDHDHVVHLFERECSVQRRHQKVIEESPSPRLDAALRRTMTEAAVAITRAVGYRNAGTIEFLVDTSRSDFFFLEMNTRLQVEHPVTEQVTGLDLVRGQLLVASGEALPWRQDEIVQRGHAIEARVYAEDPFHGFIPQAGRLTTYREPVRPGIRIDSGVVEGSEISVHYDPMIAKVIGTAETRPLAISRLAAALREFQIDGVTTNIGLLIGILEHEAFRRGEVDTAFLDRTAIPSPPVTLHQSPPATSHQPLAASERRDPWSGAPIVRVGHAAAPPRRTSAAAAGALTAPMPATVIRINVSAGDRVSKADVVMLLEAMKMELPIRAPGDGVVKAVHCREGELVDADAPLIEIA